MVECECRCVFHEGKFILFDIEEMSKYWRVLFLRVCQLPKRCTHLLLADPCARSMRELMITSPS